MKIVIIGVGTIGKTILKNLSGENHTITIIDEDRERIESLIESYDVFGVVGNGACLDIQTEAKVRDADLVIALTGSDELNILSCLVANKAGAKNTIARVRNPAYTRQFAEMKDELGISMIINPEKETAEEIYNLISLPSVAQIENFAKGKVSLVEIVLDENSYLVGETLISISKKIKTKVLICAVQRANEVFIPTGNTVLAVGDRINFTADAASLGDFLNEINLVKSPLRKIMIVGGGKVGYYLAEKMDNKKKHKLKIVESDKERAEYLAEALPKATVVCGDGRKHGLLLEEGIESIDAFIPLTGNDEENIIASMFANKVNVRKTITQIKSDELYDMLGELGIFNTVSTKSIVASKILSYIRAIANKRGSNVLTLYRLVNGQVEAVEFFAKKQGRNIYEKPLRDLKIKERCIIACIIRDDMVIIPDGNSCIKQNDNVIVVTTHKNFDDLTDIFE